MKTFREIWRIITLKYKDDNANKCKRYAFLSMTICIAASIMLVQNMMINSRAMMITSIILVVGSLISMFSAYVFKMGRLSSFLLAALLIGVFTVFPITGGNEGFAPLWLLLIPMFSVSLFGVWMGLFMALYFMVLLIVLFYTPLNVMVKDLYTSNFLMRFPVLYIVDVFVAMYISFRTEYYYNKVIIASYTDDLTKIYNRRFFLESVEKEIKNNNDFCIVVMDVNGLKVTNDTLGHAAGDELLQTVPKVCKRAFGNSVIMARMGGDEFAILSNESREAVEKKIAKMNEYAKENKGNLVDSIYISTGIASTAEHKDLNIEELYRLADSIMYEEKAAFYSNRQA
ncbi:MAG: GGDEF domain-containing protein [Lachnospiraceae bacterium]|nr:GGDEF domain-containing protein [Lachnospiraceae bacterium]